jgi:hypothetical protein
MRASSTDRQVGRSPPPVGGNVKTFVSNLMEEQMTELVQDSVTPRRSFLGRVGAAAVLAFGTLSSRPSQAQAQVARSDSPDWPGALKGSHRQVVDAYAINAGFPLTFALTFLMPNESASAVVVLRHGAFPIALEDAMWQKYKIGEAFKIIDPETKTAAQKNPFLRPKAGVLLVDDMALDRLLKRGVIFGACNMALIHQSGMLAEGAGVSADEAAKEWAANIVPGVTLIPSGTWGVNRAQEAGCTYCAGG